MKKFNFAALLPGFLALNNSVWASDSSTGASDLPGMTLNEHDLVIAPLNTEVPLQGIAVIAPIEAIVLTDHHQVAGTMVAALLIIQKHTAHQAHLSLQVQEQVPHRPLPLCVRFVLTTITTLLLRILLELQKLTVQVMG